eukprot:4524339-Pyramimonas_sp.AAC.1
MPQGCSGSVRVKAVSSPLYGGVLRGQEGREFADGFRHTLLISLSWSQQGPSCRRVRRGQV